MMGVGEGRGGADGLGLSMTFSWFGGVLLCMLLYYGALYVASVVRGLHDLNTLEGLEHTRIIIIASEINNPTLFKRLLSLRSNLNMLEITYSLLNAVVNRNQEIVLTLLRRVDVRRERDYAGMTVYALVVCFLSTLWVLRAEAESFGINNDVSWKGC